MIAPEIGAESDRTGIRIGDQLVARHDFGRIAEFDARRNALELVGRIGEQPKAVAGRERRLDAKAFDESETVTDPQGVDRWRLRIH